MPGGPLPSFGPRSTRWLAGVGIHSLADLDALGAVEAYRRVKRAYPREVTLNMLWGLQAALLGIHWRDIPPEMKASLRRELDQDPP